MAFTKIAAPAGIDTSGSIVVNGINATGIITATSIIAGSATFSGNVTVGGTVTYEDVTNIDSLGIITARTGVRIIDGGLVVTAGITTFTSNVNFGSANNIRIGDATTGCSITSGINNFFAGVGAGQSTTTGISNNFFVIY